NISVQPLSWPINMGKEFKGVYNIYNDSLLLFTPGMKATEDNSMPIDNIQDPILEQKVGEKDAAQLREDIELINGVYDTFDTEAYLKGQLAPVFFGSAVNNFGIKELLDTFVKIAPSPLPRPTTKGEVAPTE